MRAMARSVLFSLAIGAGLAVLPVLSDAAHAQGAAAMTVPLDQARIVKLPEKVATLVVGNPLIADVTIEKGGMMVVTGKGFGTTNVLALDSKGNQIWAQNVTVGSPDDKTVVVQRGDSRETFSCAPTCERRITLGDAKDYFDGALGQASTRSAKAAGR